VTVRCAGYINDGWVFIIRRVHWATSICVHAQLRHRGDDRDDGRHWPAEWTAVVARTNAFALRQQRFHRRRRRQRQTALQVSLIYLLIMQSVLQSRTHVPIAQHTVDSAVELSRVSVAPTRAVCVEFATIVHDDCRCLWSRVEFRASSFFLFILLYWFYNPSVLI